ncbi:MAG: GGDEF domain-containing protein [Phycisphaerales bacterium]|nr:GGDEF domain-containing protein [Phycisphaerales bacterium]
MPRDGVAPRNPATGGPPGPRPSPTQAMRLVEAGSPSPPSPAAAAPPDGPAPDRPPRDRLFPEETSTPPPHLKERLRPAMAPVARASLLAVGVAGATGLTVLTFASSGLPARLSVILALPVGFVLGFLFSMVLIVLPEARAARHRLHLIDRIRAVARADRDEGFDILLAFDEQHELAHLAREVHQVVRSTHSDRLESARVRREMEAQVERRLQARTSELRALSLTDDLTGLANRRGFEQGLAALVARASREGREVALLALDLDHFKRLNDTCGHHKGDEALQAAAEVILANVRAGDLAGRIGGDELFVALYASDGPAAERVAGRLIELFRAHPSGIGLPVPWPGLSVGIALLRADSASGPDHLKQLADAALYASKRSGRGRVTRARRAA